MKKLSIIAVLFLVSCTQSQYDVPNDIKPFDFFGETLRTFEYEGCQYIIVGTGDTRMMSHKGNCSNPIHKCKCN